jgi:prevent-host-death family protein
MEKIPITEARNKFMKLPEEAAKHKILAVTRRNKEVMVVMSWELYEGLLETLEVLHCRKRMKGWTLENRDVHKIISFF